MRGLFYSRVLVFLCYVISNGKLHTKWHSTETLTPRINSPMGLLIILFWGKCYCLIMVNLVHVYTSVSPSPAPDAKTKSPSTQSPTASPPDGAEGAEASASGGGNGDNMGMVIGLIITALIIGIIIVCAVIFGVRRSVVVSFLCLLCPKKCMIKYHNFIPTIIRLIYLKHFM